MISMIFEQIHARKMKETVLLLLMLLMLLMLLGSGQIFSLGADYFRRNDNVDYLYVDSPEGLRIRSSPSLSGKKIGVLFDRMKVKVISIGGETTIDGIKSNWVEILLPVETLKSNSNVCGWIFGGYLADSPKPFSTRGWTDSDLKRYLCRFSWTVAPREFHEFGQDGTYRMGLLESGAGGNGAYSASMRDGTITVSAKYGDEEGEGGTETTVFRIAGIEEDKMTLKNGDAEFVFRPSFTHSYFYGFIARENVRLGRFEETSLNALMYPFSSEMVCGIERASEGYIKRSMGNLIKMGISIDNDEYKIQYDSRWK